MAERTLLNLDRNPIFCPGCSHDKILGELDKTLVGLGLQGHEVCIVTDIGCSGFFDVYFNTHAFHGVHGRALTYATGIKLAQPELTVVVIMGDGGLGIGAAHVIATCRRNLDLTLLILNNFNFGMTGGQYSCATPNEAVLASGFLNKLDKPLDPVSLAITAGAPFACASSAYQKDLGRILCNAIEFKGFSVVEIQGICPGRYSKTNRITPQSISAGLESRGPQCGEIEANKRVEFGEAYRKEASSRPKATRPVSVEVCNEPVEEGRQEVVILGAAGQRVVTAGEILALAALSAGLFVSQKNEYDVTVLRGPSISELILSHEPIDYNGAASPSVVIVLAEEGVSRRKEIFSGLGPESLALCVEGPRIPGTPARIQRVDLKGLGVKRQDWALVSLSLLAQMGHIISEPMLHRALEIRFQGETLRRITESLAGVRI